MTRLEKIILKDSSKMEALVSQEAFLEVDRAFQEEDLDFQEEASEDLT